MLRSSAWWLGSLAAALVVTGCANVLGLGDYESGNGGAAASTTGSNASQNGSGTPTGNGSGSGMPSGSDVSATSTGDGVSASSSTGMPPASGELLSLQAWGEADDQEAWGVAVASDGSAYVGGIMSGSIVAGSITLTVAARSIFVIKIDASGVPEWGRAYPYVGGGQYDRFYGLVADDAGVYLAGFADGQLDFGTTLAVGFFAAKIDPAGTLGWTKSCGGSSAYDVYDNAGSLALGAVGGANKLYAAIPSSGGVNCGGINSNGNLLVRLDATSGMHEVSSNVDSDTYEYRAAVAPDALGGAYYGDRSGISVWSVQGLKQFENTCPSTSDLVVDPFSGDLMSVSTMRFDTMCGGPVIDPVMNNDAFAFIRYNAALGFGSQLVLSEGGQGKAIALTPSGDIALGGDHDLQIDFGGGALSSTGGKDAGFALYDSTMMLKWVKHLGGAGDDVLNDIAANDQVVVAVGSFASASASFGATTLTGKGGKDVWVARIAR